MSHPAFTVQLQSITALWPVLISRSAEVRRLSWPAWVAGYMPRWYPRQKTVTHPSPNPLRCNLISPTSLLLRQTNDRINCRLKPRPHQPQCPSNIVERYKINDFFRQCRNKLNMSRSQGHGQGHEPFKSWKFGHFQRL